jgi:hypothetical protein
MANRKIFREYAKSKGKEAKEFKEIREDWYNQDTLITKNNKGELEETSLNYKDMVFWLINNNNFKFKNDETD